MLSKSRYTKNSIWMVSEKAIRMGVGAIVGIWMARYLGPENFGLLSFALALVALFTPLTRAGLDNILVRELINQPENEGSLLRAGFFIRAVASLAVLAVFVGGVIWVGGGALTGKSLLVLLVAASLIFQPIDVLEQFFQARVDAKVASICRIIQTLLLAAIRAALILSGAPVEVFAAVLIIETFVLGVLLWGGGKRKRAPSLVGSIPLDHIRLLLKESWPMVLSGIAVILYMRIDQVMIERMIGDREVGLYSAALKISELWFAIMMVFSTSLLPLIVAGAKEAVGSNMRRLQKLFFLMIWFNIIVAIGITFSGGYLLPLIFGSSYSEAVPALAIHIWTGPFVALGLLSGNWLIAENLQTLALVRTVLGAIVNVLLNLLLIPSAGIMGAAMASLAAQVCSAFLFDILSPRTRGMFLVKLMAFLSPVPLK